MIANKYVSNDFINFNDFSDSIKNKKIIFSSRITIPSGTLAERVICAEFSKTQLSLLDRILNLIFHIFSKQFREAKKIIRTNLPLFHKKEQDCELEKNQKLSSANLTDRLTAESDKVAVKSFKNSPKIDQTFPSETKNKEEIEDPSEQDLNVKDSLLKDEKPSDDIRQEPKNKEEIEAPTEQDLKVIGSLLKDEIPIDEEFSQEAEDDSLSDKKQNSELLENCLEDNSQNRMNEEFIPLTESTSLEEFFLAKKDKILRIIKDLEAISRDSSLHDKHKNVIGRSAKIIGKIQEDFSSLSKDELLSLRKLCKKMGYIYLNSTKLTQEDLKKIKYAGKLINVLSNDPTLCAAKIEICTIGKYSNSFSVNWLLNSANFCGHLVKKIDLNNINISNEDLVLLLDRLPNLNELTFSLRRVYLDGLQKISRLRKLEKIDFLLSPCNVESENIKNELSKLADLKTLILGPLFQIENNDLIDLLGQLPKLEHLGLRNKELSPQLLTKISELPHLVSLDLSHCENIRDEDIEILANFSQLNSLVLSIGRNVTQIGLNRLVPLMSILKIASSVYSQNDQVENCAVN